MRNIILMGLLWPLFSVNLIAQVFTGKIVDENMEPVPYVNIGVPNKGIGTVSTEMGDFSLDLRGANATDSIKISCIGFSPKWLGVDNAMNIGNTVVIDRKVVQISELTIIPKKVKEKTLGVETTSSFISIGFDKNELGKEAGLLMRNRHKAYIKRLNFNFSGTSYDSIFYRLNIYKVENGEVGESVLKQNIFLNLSSTDVEKTVSLDLKAYAIDVEGDFLVALEHVRNLGDGFLYFCGAIKGKSYFRSTSQAAWTTLPFGVSISAKVLVEKG